MFAVIAVLTFLLLARAFCSVVLAAKAVLLNLLSLAPPSLGEAEQRRFLRPCRAVPDSLGNLVAVRARSSAGDGL